MIFTVQIIMAFLGSLGFAMLYNIRGSKLLYAAAGGLLGWLINLSCGPWLGNEAAQYFFAAVGVTFYAEALARLQKTPATTFLIPAIIPLVPGSALYYTMSFAVNGLWPMSMEKGIYTVVLALSLAAGIMVASTLWRILILLIEYRDRKHESSNRPLTKGESQNG